MKSLLLILSSTLILSASNATAFFKASKEHRVLCHATYNSYIILDQNNANIVLINNNEFFKAKGENLYIPTATCSSIEKRDSITY